MNPVGIRIKKLREERGIRQELIANEVGLTQSAYSKIEKDDSRLKVDKLVKIAEVLKVPVSIFFGEEVEKMDDEKIERQTQAQIETLVQYIASLKEEIMFLKEEIVYLRNRTGHFEKRKKTD